MISKSSSVKSFSRSSWSVISLIFYSSLTIDNTAAIWNEISNFKSSGSENFSNFIHLQDHKVFHIAFVLIFDTHSESSSECKY